MFLNSLNNFQVNGSIPLLQIIFKVIRDVCLFYEYIFRSLEVFPKFHQIPQSKMLTFYRKEPFQLDARYSIPPDVPIPDPYIGKMIVFSQMDRFLYNAHFSMAKMLRR